MDFDDFSRWLNMAKYTLKSALSDLEGRFFSWVCFKAHQCGEFAVKALLRGMGKPAYGHSIYKFLEQIREMGIDVPDSLIKKAKTLDQYYTPTRYPDVWSEGAPFEFYSEDDAKRAIDYCSEILVWVEKTWMRLLEKEKE